MGMRMVVKRDIKRNIRSPSAAVVASLVLVTSREGVLKTEP